MNQKTIPASELILNEDGSIYHLNLMPDDIGDTIITVGDPDRIEEVVKYFDKIHLKKNKREFVTVTGSIGSKTITVISTGIGTDNIDIVFNELDTLVNVDLQTRKVKGHLTKLAFYRIGTSGTLQESINVDDFVVSEIGLGLGGLMNFYNYIEPNDDLCKMMDEKLSENNIKISSYSANLSNSRQIDLSDFKRGITVTLPGFYGPQGRELRADIKSQSYVNDLSQITYKGLNVTNFEMETAGIYGLANYLGHDALSFNAILAHRKTNTFSREPLKTVDKLIKKVLDGIMS